MIHDLIGHRGILLLMIQRDLRGRYAGSLLGAAWSLIHPMLLIAIYIAVLGSLLSRPSSGGAGRGLYAAHLCAGIIPWLLFSEILSRCSTALLENANLLTKLSFPAIILPVSVFANAVATYTAASVFLMALLWLLGFPLGAGVTLYFAVLLAVALLALGLGLFAAILNVYFRDLGQFIAVFLQLFFWLNPIVYFKETEGMGVSLQRLIELNPFHHYILAAQWACFAGAGPSPDALPLMVAMPVVVLMAGASYFSNQRRAVLDEF
jgi:lipopolysaccharide transport system permease protein